MKKLIVVACLFFCTQPAYALLSPLNQSLEEVRAIVQSSELEKYLPQSMPIIEIRHTEKGYLLITQKLQVWVEIEYLPSSYPGRQQFKLNFHQATPSSTNSVD